MLGKEGNPGKLCSFAKGQEIGGMEGLKAGGLRCSTGYLIFHACCYTQCGRYVRRGWVVGKWGVWLDLARSARHCIYPIGEQPTLLMHIANQHKWDVAENKIRVQMHREIRVQD